MAAELALVCTDRARSIRVSQTTCTSLPIDTSSSCAQASEISAGAKLEATRRRVVAFERRFGGGGLIGRCDGQLAGGIIPSRTRNVAEGAGQFRSAGDANAIVRHARELVVRNIEQRLLGRERIVCSCACRCT